MAISKRSVPFMNCYMNWCTNNLKTFSYDHFEEFNEWLDSTYKLLWNGVADITFNDPKDETAFLLKWS